ncbi:nitroreductase family protein [Flavobacterium sp. W22_SRS_FK3]|uniref:nitroreductase family protein n=1 Tax=Flavobacterium sp. W22_SRS_FK3 TaxID=3240275 RepID=UPI003F9026F4
MKLLETLNWRYAVKKYNTEIVSNDKVEKITEAINLAATSTGIQPFRIIVVNDKELQKKLGEGSFNSQIAQASHLLVFAAFDNVTKERIGSYIKNTATVREIPEEALEEFKNLLESYLLNRTGEENFIWASKQAYIGLGTALIAAAELGVDTTPMEGFDNAKFDELLNLKQKGLKSVVILSLGYRDSENDVFSQLKKARVPIDEFVVS